MILVLRHFEIQWNGSTDWLRAGREFVTQAASGSAPVLLLGTPEAAALAVAQLVHQARAETGAPFVVFCALGTKDEDLASELWGPIDRKPGAWELSQSGTLFLPALDRWPSKLLQGLAEKLARDDGPRLVASSEVPTRELVRTRRFPKELAFALNSLVLELPTVGLMGRGDLNETLEAMEYRLLSEALTACHYNQVKAAEALGITRGALQYKMKKYGLHSDEDKEAA